MKPRTISSARRATRDEAALWAARLDNGNLSAAQRVELETWLRGDPTRRALLSAYCQLSVDLEQQLPAIVSRPVDSAASASEAPGRAPRWRGIAVAGVAAALALGFGLNWRPRESEPPAAIATAPARRETVTLADGTRADLNARTTLRVDFRDSAQRLVRLERGEALFTVAKNPERPFVVETPGGRIRVTGTIFNLRADETGRLEVSVLEGSVEVAPHDATEPLQLLPGDQAALADGRLVVRRSRPELTTGAAAWREGQVVFDDLPLGDAIARFAAYHDRAIEVAPEVTELRLGGRYSLDDLDGFLAALARVLPVHVERGADGFVRVAPRQP